MANVLDAPPATDVAREGFYLWTEQQAERLRAGRFDELDIAVRAAALDPDWLPVNLHGIDAPPTTVD